MNYHTIKKVDIANGPGVRVSLFVSGCRLHCRGCFNSETWDFDSGQPYTIYTSMEVLEALSKDFIQGLTVLGGEPLEPENINDVLTLLYAVKTTMPSKDIWLYTGKTLENLLGEDEDYNRAVESVLEYVDVLVDGPFVEELKDITLEFRGSSNQRVIKQPYKKLQKIKRRG